MSRPAGSAASRSAASTTTAATSRCRRGSAFTGLKIASLRRSRSVRDIAFGPSDHVADDQRCGCGFAPDPGIRCGAFKCPAYGVLVETEPMLARRQRNSVVYGCVDQDAGGLAGAGEIGGQ